LSGKYVLRESDVVQLSDKWVVFGWTCPICGYRTYHYNKRRVIQAARYHLERKHNLVVEVREGE
jgi:hypothetical protein